ncbi:MAG: NAD(P)H-hydrate epimerase [Anaerolineae bacterium]
MIPFYRDAVPYLSTDQMREVDRLMIDYYHIELIQMMEHAGRNLATLARHYFFEGQLEGKAILVLAGTGGNGGGALVSARWLHNAGAKVDVILSAPDDKLTPVPAHQLDILHQMGLSIAPFSESIEFNPNVHLIVDGLIGYSLTGAPRGTVANLIHAANAHSAPILALDVPSGVDATTGTVLNPAINAHATMTLALPKVGLKAQQAQTHIGALFLANIGVPPILYQQPTLAVNVPNLFNQSDIIRIA